MDDIAEKGYAAHWKYKDSYSNPEQTRLEQWIARVRDMLESNDTSAIEFVDDFRSNLFSDEVFVFTPKGELKTLKLLEQLPDSYVLFNQVDVPNLRAKRGFTELDLVVVGRKGLVEYILSYRPKRSPKNTEKVIQQLVSLKQSSC